MRIDSVVKTPRVLHLVSRKPFAYMQLAGLGGGGGGGRGRTRSRVTHIMPSQQKVSHSVAVLF